MYLFREKETRNHLLFLAGFSMLLLLLVLPLGWFCTRGTKRILIEREAEIVSSLLEQGVSERVAAAALNGRGASAEGKQLLRRLGWSEETSALLFPSIREKMTALFAAGFAAALFLGFILMTGSFLYLRRRERLYRDAADVVDLFAEGNFDRHFPAGQTGTLYRMFFSVEKLATALCAQTEAEHKAKEFLKETVADISHQLKTPLAALLLYTEIILGDAEDPARVREFAEKSLQSLTRMEQLIQTLLKVMRLDAGSVVFGKQVCRIAELVARAAEDFLVRAKEEDKHLIFDGGQEECVCCDPEWTCEALGNLIKNALDHTGPKGEITVKWERSPAMIRITVADNGTGIAPEDIHHIFKRFYRSAHTSGRQGAGLGLPLAKAVIEGQGGLLTVQSVPDKITTFTVLLAAI